VSVKSWCRAAYGRGNGRERDIKVAALGQKPEVTSVKVV